jgi:hypothetical protein
MEFFDFFFQFLPCFSLPVEAAIELSLRPSWVKKAHFSDVCSKPEHVVDYPAGFCKVEDLIEETNLWWAPRVLGKVWASIRVERIWLSAEHAYARIKDRRGLADGHGFLLTYHGSEELGHLLPLIHVVEFGDHRFSKRPAISRHNDVGQEFFLECRNAVFDSDELALDREQKGSPAPSFFLFWFFTFLGNRDRESQHSAL